MNINSSESSTYTNAAYSNKGFSGMASGIDTESLVQSMLSGMQNKIDKQNQEKQRLEWKQEIYRDIVDDINDFQNKYFNVTSKTSLRMTSFFNNMKTECSSSAVKVSATDKASDTELKMQVARLASASSVSSTRAGSDAIETVATDKANSFEYSRDINIKIGDKDFNVDFKGENGKELTADEIAKKINDAVGSDFAKVKKEYKDADGNELTLKNGKFYDDDGKIVNENDVKTNVKGLIFETNKEFQISGSSAGMSIIGLSGTVKSKESDESTAQVIESKAVNNQFSKVGAVTGSVDVTLDGVKKSISIKEGESMEEFGKKVTEAFGNTVKFTKNSDDSWGISVEGKGRNLTISANIETMKAIGFDKKAVSNQVLRTDTLSSLGISDPPKPTDPNVPQAKNSFSINGKEIEYTSEDTISSIMNKINSSGAGVKVSFDDLSGRFKMQSESTGAGFDIKVEGDDEGLFSKLGFAMNADGTLNQSTVKQGQNAIVNINGVTVERANNNFSYNGLKLSLKATTGTYETDAAGNFIENADGTIKTTDGSTEAKAEITTTRDTDKIVETLKSFVDDYNTLIEKLNKYTRQDASYKKYPPLTDAQKKEMSEKEIELWEEKSKEGLLRNDKDVSSFLSDMRSAMYTRAGSKLVLSNIGIDSSDNWRDYGKLSVDEDKLKSALESDTAGVIELFTGDNGLATRLNKICDKTASTSSGNPGSLVTMAGAVGKGTENNNIIKDRLDNIAEKLKSLNRIYEQKKDRYWKQFNAMEEALSNMNNQSSWLNSMLGY